MGILEKEECSGVRVLKRCGRILEGGALIALVISLHSSTHWNLFFPCASIAFNPLLFHVKVHLQKHANSFYHFFSSNKERHMDRPLHPKTLQVENGIYLKASPGTITQGCCSPNVCYTASLRHHPCKTM